VELKELKEKLEALTKRVETLETHYDVKQDTVVAVDGRGLGHSN
jgi:hypothetical protein